VSERKVAIFQPYVPRYRVKFFEALIESLAVEGVICKVASGSPSPVQGARGDASHPDWAVEYRSTYRNIFRRQIDISVPLFRAAGADAVIVGHVGSSLNTNLAVLRGLFGPTRVGLWGHIRSYTSDPNAVDAAVERWQLRHADHVFAYTPGGTEHAIAAGVLPRRVTTVMNAVDTSDLASALRAVDDESLGAFRATYSLPAGRTVAFIGALDRPKRIEFLMKCLERVWVTDPDVHLIVAGRGELESMMGRWAKDERVAWIGRAGAAEKAIIAHVASAIVMPGRIGLIANDALQMGIPVLTTPWAYHAPEVEYLVDGESMHTSAGDTVESFAGLLVSVLGSPQKRHLDWKAPTLDEMVANFSRGVMAMLSN
jgi:glycosyltransferase involved in cell wall biosynthesis